MAFRCVVKKLLPICKRYAFFHPFSKNSTLCIVSVLPNQIRKFHISSNLFKELVRFNLADIGEGIKEVVIKEWYIKVGDRISQFNNICEVQSDKATVTITSRYDGLVKKIYYDIDGIAAVGKPLIDIEVDSPMEDEAQLNESVSESYDNESLETHRGVKVSTTPSVRKLAKENSINLVDIIGTGPQGRILKEDVINFINQKSVPDQSQKESVNVLEKIPIKPPVPHVQKHEIQIDDKILPLTSVQKAMMKTMNKAKNIPDFSYCDEINVTALSEMKNSINTCLKDTKMTFMPFFIKAASLAIFQFPQLNSQFDELNEHLICKKHHNIGFALDSPIGLMVPKIHSVERKSIIEISLEMSELIVKAQRNKLTTADLSDGTFTISNIGSIGGTYASPIILPPEIVIGAFGKIQKLPRFNEAGEVIPVNIIYVTWTADHRVIDGATLARYSNLWKSYIEKPELLLIHLR